MYGYWGRVLRIDMNNKKYYIEDVKEDIWNKFLGGSGYGAKVLLEETPPAVDPLSEGNKLIFGIGAFQAVKAPGSAKWSVTTKSPLTKTFLDSAGGGHWAPLFKKSGYDALIIEGKSDKPLYLYISDNIIEFREAQNIWGKDTIETTNILKKELKNNRISILNIGPSGEILNPIACISCDGHSFAGRGGAGAVMGSKGLKAIVASGKKQVPVYNEKYARSRSVELMKELAKISREWEFTKHGTPMVVGPNEKIGDLPMKYWTADTWSEVDKISTPRYTEYLNAKPRYCVNCPIGCHRDIDLNEPDGYKVKGSGPEYETVGMMGGAFLCSDLGAIAKANDICNRMGIDTVSTGAFVSFLAECQEKGLIDKEDTYGMEINWGDGKVLVALTEKIALMEGIGLWFKEGIQGAARKVGHEAEKLIVHVKNLDYPAHDPRAFLALGVNYATGTRGACHERGDCQGIFYPELGMEKAPNSIETAANYAYITQNVSSFYNQVTMCKFMVKGAGMTLTQILEIFNAITGWNWSVSDLFNAGRRAFTIQRLINVRDGYSRKDDILPEKIAIPAKEGGRVGKAPVPHDRILNEYYKLRAWDEDGRPTLESLKRIGLAEYIKYLSQ
jgi:aldehyde:ferredoxin oxidoreductase